MEEINEKETRQEKQAFPENPGSILVITGLSGAGKSLCLKCLEDMDYFCVDNLLPALIPKFVQLCASSDMNRIAFVIDIRGRKFFKELQSALMEIPEYGFSCQILFLEASDEILVRRFSESRRRHPLAPKGRLLDGITYERKLLEEIRGMADEIIDTSNVAPNKLKLKLVSAAGVSASTVNTLNITVVAFGFKYGVPLDADIVYDVRFLPNPYYIEDLRHLTGNNAPVKEYVLKFEETKEFLGKFLEFNKYLIPKYIREGKSNLTIAVGCTGGKHRSVVIANELAKALEDAGYRAYAEYREIKY